MILAWETYHWFLVMGIPLIIVELLGAFYWNREGRDADTISQMWWDFRNSLPKPVAWLAVLAMLAFLGWLMFHFALEGWEKIKETVTDQDEPAEGEPDPE